VTALGFNCRCLGRSHFEVASGDLMKRQILALSAVFARDLADDRAKRGFVYRLFLKCRVKVAGLFT
jgi:hypothetical protein